MSWIVCEQVSLYLSDIKRLERKEKENKFSIDQLYDYFLITKEGKKFELRYLEFTKIKSKLDNLEKSIDMECFKIDNYLSCAESDNVTY